jgi:glycosyltransferase involved in cell wall biosynthesis
MIRILHIFPSSAIGGSELCALETINALNNTTRHKNYAVFPDYGPMQKKGENEFTKSIILHYDWWVASKPWSLLLKIKMVFGFFKSAQQLKKKILENKINIVISHTLVTPIGAMASMLTRRKHLWYIHEYGDLDHSLNFCFGKKLQLTIMDHLSDGVIVNSSALQKHFQPFFPNHNLEKINYVVNYPTIKAPNKKDPNKLNICMVGRIAPGKNQIIALEALAILKKEGIRPKLIFVGGHEPRYLNELKAYISTHQLYEQVTFISHTTHPWTFVESSDCVLVCSLNEAFGRVTVEGMKAGRIVVASNSSAGPEIINHGKTGFLFSPNAPKELAQILKDLYFSDDLSKIAQKGQITALENYNADKHSEQIEKIFEKLRINQPTIN